MIENSTYSDANKQPISLNTGIDIFYNMLIKPIQTLNVLSNSDLHPATASSFLGALLVVAVSALTAISSNSYSSSFTTIIIVLNILGSFFGTVFFWFALAVFLRTLAALFKAKTSLSFCFIVTGWAFVPLIFRAIATCFSNATIFGDILVCCLSIWFLLLQLFAFDSVLKLGRFKTLGAILILPPCLFFTYFISLIFAGIIISDGLF